VKEQTDRQNVRIKQITLATSNGISRRINNGEKSRQKNGQTAERKAQATRKILNQADRRWEDSFGQKDGNEDEEYGKFGRKQTKKTEGGR